MVKVHFTILLPLYEIIQTVPHGSERLCFCNKCKFSYIGMPSTQNSLKNSFLWLAIPLLQIVALHLQSQISTDCTSPTLRCTKLSCGLQARHSLFGDVAQCGLVTSDRRFGTAQRAHIQGSIQDFDCIRRQE